MTVWRTEGMGLHGATWEAKGYSGAGNVESLIDRHRDLPAIVCGSAQGVFDEYEAARKALPGAVIFAANDTGIYLPDADHVVTLHAPKLHAWKTLRWLHNNSAPEKAEFHTTDDVPAADYVWAGLSPLFMLSGYFAMQVAYLMGCNPIVLAGCPGSACRRFFESSPRSNYNYGDASSRNQVIGEMTRIPDFKETVRSMSGWSNSFFGGIETLRKMEVG